MDNETFDKIFRAVQRLALEKEFWTAQDLAEEANCTIGEAEQVIKELNI